MKLLNKKRFLPFFVTQLLGALNDNLYKNGLTVFIAFQTVSMTQAQSNSLVNIAAGLFILPFFLFSTLAGQLADKYEKSALIARIKLLEIAIMLLAVVAFYVQSINMLIALLFLMGTQSAFFGPVKYSLLPQVLKDDELVGGNALVEFGTFIAILVGMILAVLIMGIGQDGTFFLSIAVVLVAISGYLSSLKIPTLSASEPDLKINFNVIQQLKESFQVARKTPSVFYSIMGISWFWFIGVIYMTQLPNYVRYELGGNEQVYVLLLTLFSFGIGAGSLLCEKLSGSVVEIGLVPIGSLGLTLFGVDIMFTQVLFDANVLMSPMAFISSGDYSRVMFDLFMMGIFGGIFIVPLYALVQQRSPQQQRARMIAANNVMNALFMVVATGFSVFALSSGLSISDMFFVVAIMNAAVAIWIFTLIPEFIMRLLVWLLIHTLYRVKKINLDKIPTTGGCVLICNHVSFVDALVLAGCIRRPIRFVMYYKIFSIPVLSFIFKTAHAIPIAGIKEDPKIMHDAFDEIANALNNEEIICIFPEGKLTKDGTLNTFKKGVIKILDKTPVPVVPLALSGLWGSVFSCKKERLIKKMLSRGLLRKIELEAGDGIAIPDIDIKHLQSSVAELLKQKKA